jgi:hypothetical protein
VSLWHDPGVVEVGSGLKLEERWIELIPGWTGYENWFDVVQWEPLFVVLVLKIVVLVEKIVGILKRSCKSILAVRPVNLTL